MNQWVDIAFDCLPLRSVTRLDIPLDASPKFRARCERIKQAIETHGMHNTYFLHNASCAFHLTNDPNIGLVRFLFEGTVFTDSADTRAEHAHLSVDFDGETCEWLTPTDVDFLSRSVTPAVLVEFNRYIAAGDLEQTKKRLALLQAQTEQSGGYVGMYL